MPKLRVHNFAISVDGYGAGPSQSLDNPLGVGGERLRTGCVLVRRTYCLPVQPWSTKFTNPVEHEHRGVTSQSIDPTSEPLVGYA